MQITDLSKRLKSTVGKGILKTAISNIGSTFTFRLAGSFISVFLEIVLIRSLGYTEYSDFTFVWVFVRLSGILFSLGFDRLVVRYVSEYSHNKNIGKLKGLLVFSYCVVTIAASVLLVGIITASKSTYIQSLLSLQGVFTTFYVAAPAIVLIAIQELQTGVLRGFGKVGHAVFWQSVAFPVAMSVVIVSLTFFYSSAVHIHNIALCGVLVLLLILVCQALVLVAKVKSIVNKFDSSSSALEFSFVEWLKVAFTMFVVRNGEQVMQKLQILIAGSMFGTAVVGFYNVAFRLVSLISYGLLISNLATAHLFARADLQEQREKMQGLITLVAYITFFSTAPIVAIFFIGIDPVLNYFGEEFLQGKSVLQVLLVAAAFNTITGPNLTLLMMMGAHKGLVLLNVASITMNLFLIFFLSPIFGYIGIAVAGSAAWITTNTIVTIMVKKRTGYNSTVFRKLNLAILARD